MPVILVFVALAHAIGVFWCELTAWKGAGFGMFSTVDSGGSRRLVVRARVGSEYYRFKPTGKSHAHLRTMAQNYPASLHIGRLLAYLSERLWVAPSELHKHRSIQQMERSLDTNGVVGLSARQQVLAAKPLHLAPYVGGQNSHRIVRIEEIEISVSRVVFCAGERSLVFEEIVSLSGGGQTDEYIAIQIPLATAAKEGH